MNFWWWHISSLLIKSLNFSNIPLDNHWHSIYTVCMEALSSPEMQNLCETKFPEIPLSLSKLNPCSHIILFSQFSSLLMIAQKTKSVNQIPFKFGLKNMILTKTSVTNRNLQAIHYFLCVLFNAPG